MAYDGEKRSVQFVDLHVHRVRKIQKNTLRKMNDP